MINQINKWMFFFCALLLASCIPDSEEFIPINGDGNVDGDLFGIVLNEGGLPIADALVTFNSRTASTNEIGVYQFENVKIDTKHNHLNIKKSGYFETTKTFRAISEGEVTLRSRLLKKEFKHSIESSNGGEVSEGVTTLKFPADAIVNDATGEDYNGEVLVALRHIDPTDRFIGEVMPGDLSGVDADGEYSALTSFGMNYVELESPTGAKLQVKSGKTVTMESSVPDEIRGSSPSSVPMWYFDNNIGLWKEEGSADLVGGKYVGEVTHFSCWNYDASEPSIILSGRVVDQEGNPVGGIHVWVAAAGQWGGGHGNTNSDGTFSGAVAKDEILELKILDYECGNYQSPVYVTTIGPFSQNTNIGDIVIGSAEEQTVTVTATATDCEANLIENGTVIINNMYFSFEDGDIDVSFLVCAGTATLLMTVIDMDDLTQSHEISLIVGENILSVVNGCEEEALHIEINCDLLNVDFVAFESLYAFQEGKKHINGNVDSLETWINFSYEDLNELEFIMGSFPIVNGNVFISDPDTGGNQGVSYSIESGTILVDEVNNIEKFIRGSYTTIATESGTDYDFYGTFKLPIN